jgi:RNA polymerase sigma-70 factor (ECF subfamily)
MPPPCDDDLLTAVARRDETAFRALYRRHTPAMYAVALRLLARNHSDAEDAIQEAWLRAVRGLAGFRGDSTLRTWLVGIAIRGALETARRRPAVEWTEALASSSHPGSVPELDLESAIAGLADGYRHVLVLHDVEGYTHAEIAGLLNISEGTSKSQLSRARAIVRRQLGRRVQECSHDV